MNRLERLSEFQKVLNNYHISESSKKILEQTNLVLLVAPSSSGRNTIIRELVKTGKYRFIISDTTRLPRINDGVMERNGVEYWFRTEDEVLSDLINGKYLEAEIIHNQQVSGMSIRELEKARHEHETAITDVDIEGIHNVVEAKQDTIPIMVLPPSFEEWQRRITNRGEMSKAEYRRRMETACKIFAAGLNRNYFFFVINDTVKEAADTIDEIVKLHLPDPNQQKAGKKLAKKLLAETTNLLNSL